MAGLGENVPWTRYWIPREQAPVLDWNRYFADPKGRYGKLANLGARTLEQLENKPCVALLGEPGIGKSRVIEAYRSNVVARAGADPVLAIDCRWEDDRDLDAALFNTEPFKRWLAGGAPLTLIIDSIDEHPQGAQYVASKLIGQIRRGPVQSLRLRIACRTAEWPSTFEEQLPQLWPSTLLPQLWERNGQERQEPRAVFYALAPLRRVDVALAAGAVAEDFIREVARMDAQPLATKPITLGFLLDEYRRNRALPRTRVELYTSGCTILCHETSPSREDAGRTGVLRPEQRFAIASRIAAVCVLGRRSLVHRGALRGSLPPDAVRLDELVGGKEPSPVGDIEVTAEAITEVLKVSGLFAPRGAYVGWAHLTYAELLAAHFLNARGLSPDDLLRELSNPTMNRIVPALRETAAWVASMNKQFFDRLMAADPEPLLRSDFAMVGDAEREALIDAVLQKVIARELPAHLFYNIPAPASRLDHPRLAEQLRPYIADKACYAPARRTAIELAEGCQAKALADLLADVALDPDDDYHVRVGAAQSVVRLGFVETKRRLKPLISGQCGPDPDDELKGHALQALWPSDLSAGELFENLTPRKNERYGGSYASFLNHHLRLEETLSHRHLPEALRWTMKLPPRHAASSLSGEGLLDKIMRMAWKHIEDAEVRIVFAKAVRERLAIHDGIFGQRTHRPNKVPKLNEDDTRRRLLAAALMSLPPWSRHDAFCYVDKQIVVPHDASWIIEQMKAEPSSSHRARWAAILGQLACANWSFEVLDPIVGEMDQIKELGEAMPWLVKDVELGSFESRKMRREQREIRKSRGRYRIKGQLRNKKPPAKKRIQECLRGFDGGDLEAGWKLQHWLAIDPERKTHVGHDDWDLTKFPGWQSADDATRDRILDIARMYLSRAGEHATEWLGKNIIYHPAAAGYRYLCLLDKVDSSWIDGHEELWRRWSAITVAFALNADQQCQRMTARAYRAQPARVLETLRVLLLKDHEGHDYPFALYKVAECWDDRLGRFLLDFVRQNDLKPRFLGEILDELIAHKIDGSAAYAAGMLTAPVQPEGPNRLRVRAAAHALMAFAPEVGWPLVRPLVDSDPAFGTEVFLSFARERSLRRSETWGKGLSIAQATDLYVWTARHFPHDEDPQDRSAGFTEVTPRHELAELRDSLLTELRSRRTPEAVEAIKQIQREFPQRDFTWALVSAKEAAAQETWKPRSPREIIALHPHPSSQQTTSSSEQAPMTRDQLFDALCTLLPPQFDTVVFKLNMPVAYIPSLHAALNTRVGDVLRWAEQQGRLADVERLYFEAIGRPAPVAPPAPAVIAAAPVAPAVAPPAPAAPAGVASFSFPPPLVAAYQQNKLAVLFGSGLSMARDVKGNFPRWNDLPERLLDQAATHAALSSAQIDAKRAFFKGGHLSLEGMLSELDTLKTALRGVRKYQAALNAVFRPRDAAPGDVHRALVGLDVSVLATTNYDPLLEAAEGPPARTAYTWMDSDKALLDIEDGRKVLFKVHGTADREETVVMTHAEYARAAAHVPYQRALSFLLQGYTFLLVGYGINDPLDLDLVFELNDRAFGAAARTHYALFKDASGNDRDRWQRDLNVQVVPYASHDDLPAILRALRATKP